jgi:predicted DNA-binding transcriptional regulator AlpA
MSSNLRIKKVCAECANVFIAKKTTSQCCSDECAKRHYKRKQREGKIEDSKEDTKLKLRNPVIPTPPQFLIQDLIDIRTLSAATGISRASLFRLMKNEEFPRLKVGRKLLFDKPKVLHYLTIKYGNL